MQSDKVAAQERVKHAARALCNARESLSQAEGQLAQAQDTAAAALKLRDQHKQLVRSHLVLESLCTHALRPDRIQSNVEWSCGDNWKRAFLTNESRTHSLQVQA